LSGRRSPAKRSLRPLFLRLRLPRCQKHQSQVRKPYTSQTSSIRYRSDTTASPISPSVSYKHQRRVQKVQVLSKWQQISHRPSVIDHCLVGICIEIQSQPSTGLRAAPSSSRSPIDDVLSSSAFPSRLQEPTVSSHVHWSKCSSNQHCVSQ